MGDTLIGLKGKDFTMLAADTTAAFSIILMKDTEDKITAVPNQNILIAAQGEQGDRVQFVEFITKNLNLYRLRNDTNLSVKASAHFLRQELAKALRSGPYQTNILIGGVDDNEGAKPELYFIDYLSSLQEVKYGAHGYGSYFVLSVLDKYYKDDMNVNECLDVLRKCVQEIQKRLLLNTPSFIVKIVDKYGSREVDLYADQPITESMQE
ncbi:hypothetical protein C9374_006929 [Naegleria lovaniensis]|uniref:Proteasome subunit beta n=1 Tax=Naegleria lovaniensis TaxID=51637 RepID=A0AA88KPQ0_NAELO|nr:uncharacterized protein C9374_006929 [Naegleria lovaniensis]KAG2393398.1 hypothetical protein C9374_006929 [Naegleria lovaniensis]